MSEIKYEMIKQVGILSKSPSGWAKTPTALALKELLNKVEL